MGSISLSLFLHVAGVVAISQLLFSGNQHNFYTNLDKNATSVLHDTMDKFLDVLSSVLPFTSVGTTLMTLVYLAAAMYVVYLARLDIQQCTDNPNHNCSYVCDIPSKTFNNVQIIPTITAAIAMHARMPGMTTVIAWYDHSDWHQCGYHKC